MNCALRVHANPSATSNRGKAARRTVLFKEIVIGHVQRLGLGRVGAPELEQVEIEMEQKDFAHHFPAGRQAVGETALTLFDQVAEVVDGRLLLLEAGPRTEEIQGYFNLETFLIPRRHGRPD